VTQPHLLTHRKVLFQLGTLSLLFLPIARADAGPAPPKRPPPSQPDFGVPEDSLAGRFHRVAFGPSGNWYIPARRPLSDSASTAVTRNSARDSVRSEIESLLVERLRSVGFEVLEPRVGIAIYRQLADSLGWIVDSQTRRVDPEREAVLHIRTIQSLRDGYGADGLIYWVIEGSALDPDLSLVVQIEDSGGHTVYRHRVDVGTDMSPGEIVRARPRYAAVVKRVLDPFCRAALRK